MHAESWTIGLELTPKSRHKPLDLHLCLMYMYHRPICSTIPLKLIATAGVIYPGRPLLFVCLYQFCLCTNSITHELMCRILTLLDHTQHPYSRSCLGRSTLRHCSIQGRLAEYYVTSGAVNLVVDTLCAFSESVLSIYNIDSKLACCGPSD